MNKKQQIVVAATKLFINQGFAAVSMDRVSQEANVSKATLYAHFSGKEALFAACLEQYKQDNAIQYPQLPMLIPSTKQELYAIVQSYLKQAYDFYRNEAVVQMYRLLVSEIKQFPELFSVFFGNEPIHGTSNLSQFLCDYAQQEQLRLRDSYFLAAQLLDLVRGATIWAMLVQNPVKLQLLNESEFTIARIHTSAVVLMNHYLYGE
jgi:TetR/AcrR family transcriptional regulator, mexJK operon transcriptional repressor